MDKLGQNDKKRDRQLLEVTPSDKSRLLKVTDNKKPKSSDTQSNSELLSKLKSFIPKLEEANKVLEEEMRTEPIEKFDIEHIEDDDGEHIVMDLHCGLLDVGEDNNVVEAVQQLVNNGTAVQPLEDNNQQTLLQSKDSKQQDNAIQKIIEIQSEKIQADKVS
eukprot:TRINITY_DN7815_c1_g1_i1.p2 TRINITY_DN7815_c1_g1~~TRINITY_DN7815_c1_g1_i1.p2  ORF type:complete len:162 (+),score=26.20 TRINITY_DN7815_c1_g1_i1:172-657(+)